jgi:hypothetical protein
MTGTCRVSLFALTTLFAAAACSSENPPATNNSAGTGGQTAGTAGTGAVSGTGGSGNETGTGGTGGATGGAGGTGGSTGGTGGGTDFSPPCDVSLTAAGAEIAKGVACTEADPQLCYKTCGPQSSGWKSETCSGGIYAEGDCQFPAGSDYSCFKIPTTLHADCPTDPALMPQASQECTVPECNPCNVTNQYKTSTGEIKVGWCVCQPPGSGGTRKWSCASGTAWPCPLGTGC